MPTSQHALQSGKSNYVGLVEAPDRNEPTANLPVADERFERLSFDLSLLHELYQHITYIVILWDDPSRPTLATDRSALPGHRILGFSLVKQLSKEKSKRAKRACHENAASS